MATLDAVRAGRPAYVRMVQRIADRHFYFVMSLVIAGVVTYGFSRSVDVSLVHGIPTRPLLLWIHGILFFAWILLFVVQSALITVRNVRLHKRLGWFVAGLGATMPPLGFVIIWMMARFSVIQRHLDPNYYTAYLSTTLLDNVAFAVAFTLALLWRGRPEYHRRLVFLAACALTAAGFARFPLGVPYLKFYVGVDALILVAMLRDLFVNRKVHAVYAWFLPPMVFFQLGAIYIQAHNPAWWIRIGRAFMGPFPS